MNGQQSQITESDMDDAFDCMIDKAKLGIECSDMMKEEKENRKQQDEMAIKTIKEGLKAQLRQI